MKNKRANQKLSSPAFVCAPPKVLKALEAQISSAEAALAELRAKGADAMAEADKKALESGQGMSAAAESKKADGAG